MRRQVEIRERDIASFSKLLKEPLSNTLRLLLILSISLLLSPLLSPSSPPPFLPFTLSFLPLVTQTQYIPLLPANKAGLLPLPPISPFTGIIHPPPSLFYMIYWHKGRRNIFLRKGYHSISKKSRLCSSFKKNIYKYFFRTKKNSS